MYGHYECHVHTLTVLRNVQTAAVAKEDVDGPVVPLNLQQGRGHLGIFFEDGEKCVVKPYLVPLVLGQLCGFTDVSDRLPGHLQFLIRHAIQ